MKKATETPAYAGAHAKAEAAFVALAAGDALGWPQEFAVGGRATSRSQPRSEFRDWERRSGGRYYAHTEIIRAGEYSDDTQLALAVARSRLRSGGAWWAHFTRTELPLWTIYERGGGGATKRAAESWIRGVAPWKQSDAGAVRKYFEAGGNGVAMRVLPHAVYFAADSEPINLLRDVATDGAATHGHPRALVGAAAYAYAVWWLLRLQQTVGFGELVAIMLDGASTWGALPASTKTGWLDAAERAVGSYEQLWQQTVSEMIILLKRAQDGLAGGSLADDAEVLGALGAFGPAKGAGTVGTAVSIYLTSRYAAQPLQAVLRAAFSVGADTDTIAAMAGGLVGALAGREWLPHQWLSVQDGDYLRQIAGRLSAHAELADGEAGQHISAKYLDTLMDCLRSGSQRELAFGQSRSARVVDVCAPVTATRSTRVRRWRLEMSDGQTLYVKKIERQAKNDEPSPTLPFEGPRRESVRREKHPEVRAVGIKLSVSDLAASAMFYENTLGLTPSVRTSRFISFGAIALIDARYGEELTGGAVPAKTSAGSSRIEIHVNDLDKFYERLVGRRVRIAQPITVMPWGVRSLHCLDPDGNVIELVERRTEDTARGA